MKADSQKVLQVFSNGGNIHYILPHFQREYTWDKTNWLTLLEDVLATYEEYEPDKEPEHFMGSLVVIIDGTRDGLIPAFKLVDGQQRLITISLILCAMRWIVDKTDTALVNQIQSMLMNAMASAEVQFKVLPTVKYGDRAAYMSLIQTGTSPAVESKIPEAYNYLRHELQKKIKSNTVDPQKLFRVLINCLQLVVINLNQDESPYKIFESLNAKGKPLSQADLVRNYIAMQLPAADQEYVFLNHWAKIEELLQEQRTVGRLGELTSYLRHYLAMRSFNLCNAGHVYARFRDRMQADSDTTDKFKGEIATLHRFAGYYNKLLRPESEPRLDIREALIRLNIMEMSTAYPFLLFVYHGQAGPLMDEQQFRQVLSILENYLVRRYIVGEPTNYLTKMFPALLPQLDFYDIAGSLSQVLAKKNYPTDRHILQALRTRGMYDDKSNARTVLILETINRHLHHGSGGYSLLNGASTIEHIMPQTVWQQWQDDLGSEWQRVHKDCLHTLGNLTLVTVGWNSQLSNSVYSIKKPKLAQHALLLNSGYFGQDISSWNETAIRDRADWLAQNIIEIWPEFV